MGTKSVKSTQSKKKVLKTPDAETSFSENWRKQINY